MATVARRPGRPPNKRCTGAQYTVGQQVLCRWTDGLFYLASICRIDDKGSRCYVQFEDKSEYWVLTKDIQKGAIRGEIYCCVCQDGTSVVPNEIVLCDNCGLGYHQQCHNPPIEPDVLKPSVNFFCRLCVFATTVKRGGALKKGPNGKKHISYLSVKRNVKAFQAMKLSLPYKLSQLTWDLQHKTNTEQCYCYCGGPGEWFRKMLQCCRCRQWFHEACIQCLQYPLICGDRFYVFVCSHCNLGPEYIQRLDMIWRDLVHLALFSLTVQQGIKYYDLNSCILPWLLQHWEALQIPNQEKPGLGELTSTVLKELHTHKARFSWAREIKKRSSLWGLRDRVPPPAPTITLPTDGRVTDAVINSINLALAGRTRRGRVYESEQCESPVPLRMTKGRCAMDMHSSIVFRNKRARKALMDPSKKSRTSAGANQELRSETSSPSDLSAGSGSYTSPEQHSPSLLSPSCSLRFSGGQCRLDSIIPPPPAWAGQHHPFKTELECQEEAACRARLLECLHTLADSAATARVQEKQASAVLGDLQVYAPTPPTSSSSSPRSASEAGEEPRPPVLQAVQPRPRGRPRKSAPGPPPLLPSHTLGRVGRPRRGCMPVLSPSAVSQAVAALAQAGAAPRRPHSVALGGGEGMLELMQPLPPPLVSKPGTTTGLSPRLPDGCKFEILGRRVLDNGAAQFLVHWPGVRR